MISRFFGRLMRSTLAPVNRGNEAVDMTIHLNDKRMSAGVGEDFFKRQYYEDMISKIQFPNIYYLFFIRS